MNSSELTRGAGDGTGTPSATTGGWREIARYAGLALGAFVCALVLLVLFVWDADRLASLGLTGKFYYLVLLPIALAVALVLFGSMRSFALYRGRHLGGTLELGGPVVGAALVVIGGFFVPAPPSTFPLTVYVHGKGGPQDMVLRSSGYVILDLGPDRRREPVGANGQAFFPAIPTKFRGQDVSLSLDGADYEAIDPGQRRRLEGTSLYLPVQRTQGSISGRVQDENGKPVPGAVVKTAGLSTTTDSDGHFEFTIPGDRMQGELSLQVSAAGYDPWRSMVVPNANEAIVILTRER